jgi:hypothetical protein
MNRFAIGEIKLLKDRKFAVRLWKTASELVVNNYDLGCARAETSSKSLGTAGCIYRGEAIKQVGGL